MIYFLLAMMLSSRSVVSREGMHEYNRWQRRYTVKEGILKGRKL
jgi:hypothetical protein